MTKTSAINRIHELLDDNSFVEVGAYITARSTDYNMQSQVQDSDSRKAWMPWTASANFMSARQWHPV